MKIELTFNSDVFVLPGTVISKLSTAGEKELKFLLAFAATPEIRSNTLVSDEALTRVIDSIVAEIGLQRSDADLALAFWRGAGIIRFSDISSENRDEADKNEAVSHAEELNDKCNEKKLLRIDSPPDYTGEEIENIFQKDINLKGLIEECQKIVGKVFTPHEISKIVALSDYLKLEHEHILLLFSYCSERGKTSIAYIEKTAYNLYNEGIDSLTAFEDYLKRKEIQNENDTRIRKLFGFGGRTITPRERKFFDTWFNEYAMSFEMIERAYQITVDNTEKLSLPYLNKILSNWHDAGYKTIDDIDAALEIYKQNKASCDSSNSQPSEGSFDTDQFFELALKRSSELMQET